MKAQPIPSHNYVQQCSAIAYVNSFGTQLGQYFAAASTTAHNQTTAATITALTTSSRHAPQHTDGAPRKTLRQEIPYAH